MNKELFKRFIEESAKEDLSEWAEYRKFDINTLKNLRIGKCTIPSMQRVCEFFSMDELKVNGFITKTGQYKYVNRIIIPYDESYFAARMQRSNDQKFKNLFPVGMMKRLYYLPGKQNSNLYLAEGETDSIRLKQEFPDDGIISIGGCKSKNLIDDIIKKIITLSPKRVIFSFDNDEAGIKATEEFIELLRNSSKRNHYKDIVYKLVFQKDRKDIDEYFVLGGKKDNLLYEKVEIKDIEVSKDSIYNRQLILPIDNYMDNAEAFYKFQPYFYDRVGIFWFWNYNKCTYEQVDDVDVMRKFDTVLGFKGQTVNPKYKNNTLEAMKRVGREKFPKEAKVKWVQFKNKAYSVFSGKIHSVTPDYFFTNPIPWELGQSDETLTFDKLFADWVGKDRVIDLYEIIAYCCYRECPIQTLVCLFGSGRNGKSCYQKIIDKFIGKDNVCSTDLDLIEGRNKSKFEVFKLYKKLVCMMGETNFGVMESSSLLKRLTAGDKVGFEKKGKDPFDDTNYAKIIIASNSLPSSLDTSDGWVRRWHIIRFPNEFDEGKDILATIPDLEYNNLALKVMKMLPDLIKRGAFTNQGTVEQRRHNYMEASNPLPIFLETYCEQGDDLFMSYNELYTAYIQYLKKNKQRRVKIKEFRSALEDEGFFPEKTSKIDGINEQGYPKYKIICWVDGIRLNDKYFTDFAHFIPLCKSEKGHIGVIAKNDKTGKISKEVAEEEVKPYSFKDYPKLAEFVRCGIEGCLVVPCKRDKHDVPYCKIHFEENGVQ